MGKCKETGKQSLHVHHSTTYWGGMTKSKKYRNIPAKGNYLNKELELKHNFLHVRLCNSVTN